MSANKYLESKSKMENDLNLTVCRTKPYNFGKRPNTVQFGAWPSESEKQNSDICSPAVQQMSIELRYMGLVENQGGFKDLMRLALDFL